MMLPQTNGNNQKSKVKKENNIINLF